MQITAKATNDLQRKVWKEAAKHQHGSGLEAGIPSFSAARKAIKHFRKNGLHNAARALEYALVGFFRDPEEGDQRTITFCHRCGKRAKATRFHIIWECSDNENILEHIFEKTKKMSKKAKREHSKDVYG